MDESNVSSTAPQELTPALQRLDDLSHAAIGLAQAAHGEKAASDPFRGLYVGQEEVEKLLARHRTGGPLLRPVGFDLPLSEPLAARSRQQHLKAAFQLSSFDLDLLLAALAPELDLRFKRLYA